MRALILFSILIQSINCLAQNINSNHGDVLVSNEAPLEATLQQQAYNLDGKFDPAFLKLSREETLNKVLNRIEYFDSEKAKIWNSKLTELWNQRKELEGIQLESNLKNYVKNFHFESTYRFENENLFLSKDVFYRLPGFQQAFLQIQAMLQRDFSLNTPKSLLNLHFDPHRNVSPYFSINNGTGEYKDFVLYYVLGFESRIHNFIEFQINRYFIDFTPGRKDIFPQELFYSKSNNLKKFRLARGTEFIFLKNQNINVEKESPEITLTPKGELELFKSFNESYNIKNLNFFDRKVKAIKINIESNEIEYIQLPSEESQLFSTVDGRVIETLKYMVPHIHFRSNYVIKTCDHENKNCRSFM